MKIAIGNDHAAVELKNEVCRWLEENGYEYKDFGCGEGEKCDYPDAAKAVGESVAAGEFDRGILICGTGIGISMAANKVKGIRAACCSDYFSAKFTRLHNASWLMFSLKLSLKADATQEGLSLLQRWKKIFRHKKTVAFKGNG